MMSIVVQWATILSPIIAVLIAWWMSRSSAKDTAKKIAALEKNTTKQIESIKELARIQLEIITLQLQKETWEARQMMIQTMKKEHDVTDDRFAMLGVPYNDMVAKIQERQEKSRNLSYDYEFYDKQVKLLDVYAEQLKSIKADFLKK